MADAPRTEGEGLDSSMEEGLTSLPAAAEAATAAAAAVAACCEYPNTIGQAKISISSHKEIPYSKEKYCILGIIRQGRGSTVATGTWAPAEIFKWVPGTLSEKELCSK